MSKIPSKRIPADDCLVYVGRQIQDGKVVEPGTGYPVHKDEWVEVVPVASVGQMLAIVRVQRAVANTPQGSQAFEELCREVSNRVKDWNWTDLEGEPLPKPYRNPEAVKALTNDELLWLIKAISDETPGERKNASGPSATSLSTGGPQPARPS